MSKPNTHFRGSELPRLLVLLVILIFGLVYFWNALYFKDGPAAEPVLLADEPPVPVVPDQSPAFETVTDKTPIGFRDMAGYVKLLKQVEEKPPADLVGKGRRDILFAHLWSNPGHYRGVPVHLLGTAFRAIRYESKTSRTGWLYEISLVTSDSFPNPYICIFEDPPKGFPLGASISERVVFDGYFLKLYAYEAHDVPRAAPLLIGRIGWTPNPAAQGGGHRARPELWMALAIAVMFVISLFRWLSGLRRTMAPRSRATTLRERPTDEIAPEALARWIESVPKEEEPDADESAH